MSKQKQRLASLRIISFLLESVFLIFLFTQICYAATYYVTNTNDDGAGSLRQAIADANVSGDDSTIEFQTGGTITLASALPDLTVQAALDLAGYDITLESNNGGSTQRMFFNDSTGGGSLTIGTGVTWDDDDDLYVGNTSAAELHIADGGVINDVTARIAYNSASTTTVSGAGSAWNNSDEIYVGYSDTGTLSVSGGGTVSSVTGSIGYEASGTGTTTITGADSTWTNTDDMFIGYSGTGTLNIENGGEVNSNTVYMGHEADSTGTATVSGAGSAWNNSNRLYVGYNSTGTLNVEDGGALDNDDTLYIGYNDNGTLNILSGGAVTDLTGRIGYNADSTGTATVSGAGSTWTNTDEIYVGYSGTGTLNIENGGAVNNITGSIGYNAAGTGAVTVSGTNSSWISTGDLYAGYSGTGTLNIENGGEVSSVNSNVGHEADSTGTATVSGAGSAWTNTSDFTVGNDGTGTLIISDNAQVNSDGDFYVGYNGTGTLTVSSGAEAIVNNGAGTLTVASQAGSIGTLNIGAGRTAGIIDASTVTGGDGTATLNFNHNEAAYGFSPNLTGTLSINHNGTGTTMLTGNTTYTGNTTVNSGTLDIYKSRNLAGNVTLSGGTLDVGANILTVNSNYTQNAGSQLAATVIGSTSGRVAVPTGNITVNGGTIDLAVNNYIQNNTTYTLIDGGSGTIAYNTIPEVNHNSPVLAFSAAASGSDLIVTATRQNPYNTLTTGNASLAGKALEEAGVQGASADMRGVLNQLDIMANASEIQQALNTVCPINDGSAVNTANTSFNQSLEMTSSRLADLFVQNQASEPIILAGAEDINDIDIWVKGFGQYIRQKPRGLSNGYYATIWGTALGGDKPIMSDNTRLGLSGGYAKSNVNSKDNSAKTDIDSYQLTLYGGNISHNKPLYINSSLSFAYNDYESSRQVAVGAISRMADSNYNGQQYSARLESGYSLKKGRFSITPMVSLQYLRLNIDDYTESGAGALSLSVDEQSYDMLQSGLGVKFEHPIEKQKSVIFPELHARWLYDFINDRQETTSTFSGGGGSFTTEGFDPPKNSFDMGAKLTVMTENFWTYRINYDLKYKEDYVGHTGWVDIRYRF
jgi:outer membrane autotransporter protein